jgi:hypothetical protein
MFEVDDRMVQSDLEVLRKKSNNSNWKARCITRLKKFFTKKCSVRKVSFAPPDSLRLVLGGILGAFF